MNIMKIFLVHGAFNKFWDFFVQAFKIVIDSRKFSMLLLYILWDDWPIFRISGSNEQLLQQLEYNLLKSDCHSWWISKMQSGHEEERYAIKLCFKLGKKCRVMKAGSTAMTQAPRDSSQCKHAGSPRPKNRQSKLNHKLLMIPFFDSTGMIYMYWVPNGQSTRNMMRF